MRKNTFTTASEAFACRLNPHVLEMNMLWDQPNITSAFICTLEACCFIHPAKCTHEISWWNPQQFEALLCWCFKILQGLHKPFFEKSRNGREQEFRSWILNLHAILVCEIWWFPWNFRMFDMRHGTMINFQWWMWPTCSWLKRHGSTDPANEKIWKAHFFDGPVTFFLKWVGHNTTGPGSNSGQGSVQKSWKERGTSRSSVTLELGLDLQGTFMPLTQVLSIDWLL